MAPLLRDLVHGLRRARIDRTVSATVIVTLALGISASTAIFSVVETVLLRPLPYRDAERLVAIAHRSAATTRGPMLASAAGFRVYRENTRSFSGMAIEAETGLNLTGDGPPQRPTVLKVSGDWFDVYGVPPLRGRTLRLDDDAPGHEHVVV